MNKDGKVEGLLRELTTEKGFPSIMATGGFMGTFDGNGNAIVNLYTNNYIGGFFHVVGNSGVIKRLILSSPELRGDSVVGGIASHNDGKIIGVHIINGTIIGVQDPEDATSVDVGGIAGYNSGIIEGAIFRGIVRDERLGIGHSAGGIVGSNVGGNIINVISDANVTSYSTAASVHTGGIVGWTESSSNYNITGIVEGGTIKVNGGSAGKAIGNKYNSKNIQVYVSTAVTLSGSYSSLGFNGSSISSSNVGNLTYYNQIIGLPIASDSKEYYFARYGSLETTIRFR